ncbi:PadR family transcriptional regulator [Microbacterium esteraromaticum]|uniref:PadR family transcriptional regulator n=1 Tax=Microbacterium esteraromaticum TaxID=57043 RepID=A0A7D8ACT9_9MICO|nr:PadR family transcriptional regulator [Microbacterium esteraromaticum]QMU96182.1 PadR family transcriptional regulator [Microbacterium esteraromaticum]
MTVDVGAQMRKGVVEYCVLGLLSREPMYGWRLAESLTDAGLIASIGTLYPLLARLRENGWVSTFDQPSESGPVRRYYRLTETGIAQLALFREQWAPFALTVSSLVREDRPS